MILSETRKSIGIFILGAIRMHTVMTGRCQGKAYPFLETALKKQHQEKTRFRASDKFNRVQNCFVIVDENDLGLCQIPGSAILKIQSKSFTAFGQ